MDTNLKQMKKIQALLLVTLFISSLGIVGCTKENNELKELGIEQTGKESELNGTWKGKVYDDLANLTLVLKDGKVIEQWISGYGMSFHGTSEDGYIGYYSFDGTNFKAVMGIDEMNGTMDGNTISGNYDESGDVSGFHMGK